MENININFSESLLNLGKLHWYLLNANMHMERGPTENDAITWWVFTQEHDIPTLRQQTDTALRNADVLKDATQTLRKRQYGSLDLLYQTYYEFGQKYAEEISTILEFVDWLHQRNVLAPTILFNYRTWSSTRMMNRIVDVDSTDLNDLQLIKKLTLVVLGLVCRKQSTIDVVRAKIRGESDERGLQETQVSQDELAVRVSSSATYDFAEYFEEIRDSLRNILLVIEQRETQERLVTSDDFWRVFITKAALSSKTEQKYWDFKQTLDMWHVKKEPEKSKKENRFSEIVAGFANNCGGVIIVGVTDSSPRQIIGLSGTDREIENYMKHTRNVIYEYISHDKDFVHFQQVNVPDQNGDYKLCLVIVVQQTVPGLGVKGTDGKSFTYPLREETGLVWKEQHTVGNHKIGTKSDNYDFLTVLQQFVNEEV